MVKMDIIPFYFENDGVIPNNQLPLLIYKNALQYAISKNFGLSFKKNGRILFYLTTIFLAILMKY
jgi:uncharacterized protein YjlB